MIPGTILTITFDEKYPETKDKIFAGKEKEEGLEIIDSLDIN